MSRRSTAASPAPLSLVKRRRRQSHGSSSRVHKVSLEKIVGLTCVTSNGLSVSPETGCIAYPAGCVVVLHLPNANGRQLHILNTTKKPISAVCLSPDGKYLAIGEYGHQPSVQVWSVAGSPSHVSELKAHKYGVQCMAFSPSMKYIVSVGYQHDMHIHVWNWRSGHCVASNKITSKVCGVSFSEDSKYFVTVGSRRVRFWTMLPSGREENHTAPLKGRSAVLGDLQDNCFVAVECGRGSIASSTYVLTRSGVLCKFDQDRSLDQFVNVQAPGRCLSLCESYIICGCGEGVVRLFDPCTLDYVFTTPLPHPLGVDVALPLNTSPAEEMKYPDIVATALDFNNKRLSVVYSDHSLYVWDMGNLRQIRKLHSSLHHSACIWDLCLYPSLSEGEGGVMPPSTLVTCSTDNTARFWSMETPAFGRQASTLVRNVYSKELKRVIYTSTDLSSLSDASKYPGDASAVADMQRGVRCIQFHPRGHQLALGDRAGNIRVYELQFMDVVFQVEAHDAEVLCIQYSPLSDGLQFMCSASRDRLIHVFTARDQYQHIQTIDDHSASITALRFTVRGDLQLLSCGADKSIMFRTLQKSPGPEFQRTSHIACKASIYDMDIDVVGKHMVTAGQDRLLRVYKLSSGKQKAVIKASTGDEGSLIKVAMDPSGLYVACSSSDKTVSLFDFYSGECLAKLYGHSEVVTQVKFSTDCRFLYSVSGDGCIFVWHLSEDLTQTMHDRLTEIGAPVTPATQLTPIKAPLSSPLRRETYFVSKERPGSPGGREEVDSSEDAQFRLSVGQLPAWAQRHVVARPSIAQSFSTSSLEKAGVEGEKEEGGGGVAGCWAERVAQDHGPAAGLLNRTASAPDVAIIDLTSPEKERNKEEEEGDVFFPPPLTPAVDPSAFKVTTPERKAKSRPADSVQEEEEEEEEEEGEASGGSNSSSPEGLKDFMKTTFESLGSEKAADDFFARSPTNPRDLRLSISARFFSQSGKHKLPGWSQNVTASRRSWSSPDLPIPGGGQRVVTPSVDPIPLVEEEAATERGEGGEEGDRKEEEGREEERVIEENTEEKEEGEVGEKTEDTKSETVEEAEVRESDIETTAVKTSEKVTTKRSPSIQEEIDKTRKRLEELGYGSLAKGAATASKTSPPPLPTPTSQQGATASKTSPPPLPTPTSQQGATASKTSPPPLPTPTSQQGATASKTSPPPLPTPTSQQGATASKTSPPPLPTPTSQQGATASKTSPPPLPTPTSQQGTPGERAAEDGPSLLSRVTQSIADINEGFRNMVALHQMAVDGLGGGEREERQEYEEAIGAIATAVVSLKRRSVSMTNRHRRRWRDVGRGGRGRGREAESSGSSSRESLELGEREEGEELKREEREEGEELKREEREEGERKDEERGEEKLEEAEVKTVQEERGVVGGAGGVVMGEDVLALLECYSQQLVELVRQKTAPPSQ